MGWEREWEENGMEWVGLMVGERGRGLRMGEEGEAPIDNRRKLGEERAPETRLARSKL
jgi:hypothetical protein